MPEENSKNTNNYLLALHSSTDIFGVAVHDLRDPDKIKSSCFETGRKLSNNLISCVTEVLPTQYWSEITRIAVATGPGGYTGTRLAIVLARTIAQQNKCSLDGKSSFYLMAPRLSKSLKIQDQNKPFWILNSSNKQGIISGQYHIKEKNKEIIELKQPQILKTKVDLKPSIEIKNDIISDVELLLKICLDSYFKNIPSHWKTVIPIYPTSPVQYKK